MADQAAWRPLADRVRPLGPEAMVGQQHLLAEGRPLRQALDSGRIHSMILWGPPGCGKTTLARMMAGGAEAEFITLSAVLSGVKDIRQAVEAARAHQEVGRRTVLFVDEVHRFNKSQQDAFLPHVESGLLTFIGATTENPSFEVNNALLSRVKVYLLKPLEPEQLGDLLRRTLEKDEELARRGLRLDDEALEVLCRAADGDARRALNLLDLAADVVSGDRIDRETAVTVSAGTLRRFDKGGDAFYDQISALHKCVRSSNPDAALYWFCRMIDGGCDPLYIARRVVRMASEDVGNADPRGLELALTAWETFERLGSPEGELAIAQAISYLAVVPKSNAVYSAYGRAMKDARNSGSLEVPAHLRNAPTELSRSLGHGRDYRYDHDTEEGIAWEQTGFPEELGERRYYEPVDRGLESRIRERLEHIRRRRAADPGQGGDR